MIKLILLVLALLAGFILGPMLAGNQGMVIISVASHNYVMSFSTLVMLVTVLFIGLIILEWILTKFFGVAPATQNWFKTRRSKNARRNTVIGLKRLYEGSWSAAEKHMNKGASNGDAPILNYLSAAKASQARGEISRRDDYLKKASKEPGKNELVIGLTTAKLYLENKEFDKIEAVLNPLKTNNSNNVIILDILQKTYINLNKWEKLLKLLPSLAKHNLISTTERSQLEIDAICSQINLIANSEDLLKYWNDLPRKNKQSVSIIVTFIEKMIFVHGDADADMILREILKKNLDAKLLVLIPKFILSDYSPLIKRLKGMCRSNKNNAQLHRSLALLYVKANELTLAKEFFEKAIAIEHQIEDYARLAVITKHLDGKEAAEKLSLDALVNAVPKDFLQLPTKEDESKTIDIAKE